jgi:hypothetical protein
LRLASIPGKIARVKCEKLETTFQSEIITFITYGLRDFRRKFTTVGTDDAAVEIGDRLDLYSGGANFFFFLLVI